MNRLLIAGLTAATASLLVAGCNGDDPTLPSGQPHTIDVFPISLSIETGLADQLEINVVDHQGAIVPGADVTATTSDPEVATVTMTDAGATVQAVSAGTAHLTFRSADAFPVHVTVRVFDPPVPTEWQAFPHWGALAQGSQTDITWRIFDQEGELRNLDQYPEDFTIDIVSADPGVIAVEGHTLVAAGQGTTTVTINGFGQTAGGEPFELDELTLNLTVRDSDTVEGFAFYTYEMGDDFAGTVNIHTAVHMVDGWPDVPNWGWPMTWQAESDGEIGTDIYIDDVGGLFSGTGRHILFIWTDFGDPIESTGTYDVEGVWGFDFGGPDETGYMALDGGSTVTISEIENCRMHGTFSGGGGDGFELSAGSFILLDEDCFAGAAAMRAPRDRVLGDLRELRRSQ